MDRGSARLFTSAIGRMASRAAIHERFLCALGDKRKRFAGQKKEIFRLDSANLRKT